VSIRLISDWGEIDREVDRISRMPDPATIARLDAILSAGFAATQAAVHIRTGSLKSSGDKSTEFQRATKEWKGEISYGGVSLGPNNPVDYAIYEQRREPDEHGDHDFMRPLSAYHIAYIDALLKGLAP
jgi:hypothetical protein